MRKGLSGVAGLHCAPGAPHCGIHRENTCMVVCGHLRLTPTLVILNLSTIDFFSRDEICLPLNCESGRNYGQGTLQT
jgi:hypothetical protein